MEEHNNKSGRNIYGNSKSGRELANKKNPLDIIIVYSVFFLLVGTLIWGVIDEDKDYLISERRSAMRLSDIDVNGVINGKLMSDFEKYLLDQFPKRSSHRALKAYMVYDVFKQKDNNGIVLYNGYLAKLDYPYNPDSVEYAAKRFSYIYDKYIDKDNANVYYSIIPDKNYYISDKTGYPSIDYRLLENDMKRYMDYAEYIDITDELELDDYYKTDSHWRQECIFDVASKLADGMGVVCGKEFVKKKLDAPFYGVYYGQSALSTPPDIVYYMDSPMLNNCSVYDYEGNSYIDVYDMEKAEGRDAYEMFLSGAKALISIDTKGAASDNRLVVFRDSFGSSLIPYLIGSYERITLVDIRYISPHVIGRYVDFSNSDILFLYSTAVLNNSNTIK